MCANVRVCVCMCVHVMCMCVCACVCVHARAYARLRIYVLTRVSPRVKSNVFPVVEFSSRTCVILQVQDCRLGHHHVDGACNENPPAMPKAIVVAVLL